MSWRARTLLLSLSIGVTGALAGANAAAEGILRLPIISEPPTLDPNLATDSTSIAIIVNLMEGLTQYDNRLMPQPAVAESWTVEQEGHRFVFKLRKDVFWSDGVPLTSQHFIDSWKRLLEPSTGAEYAYFLFDVENAMAYNAGEISDFELVGVKAPDPHTLEVQLNKPAVYFPSVVTFMVTFPIRLDVIDRYGDGWTEPENMVVNGPFRLKEWWHDYRVVLESNPTYYGMPKPKLDQIRFQVVEEKMTQLALYETGALDIVEEFHPLAIDHYKSHDDFTNRSFLRGYYYGFNTAKRPFDDVRVRKALAHAIDRDKIVAITKGGEKPTASWIPEGMFGYNPDIGLHYDPKKAKALLAEAGYPDGSGFPSAEAVFNTDDKHRSIAENLQNQWKEGLGIHVELRNMEWKVFLNKLDKDSPTIFRLGWGADYPDPDNFMQIFASYSGNNHTNWGDEEYDRLIQNAASESDLKIRKRLYDRAQRILLEENAAIIPLFNSALNKMIKPYVRGLAITSIDVPFLKTVSIDKKTP